MLNNYTIIIFIYLIVATNAFASSGNTKSTLSITEGACLAKEYVPINKLNSHEIAQALGWVKSNTFCGGLYVDSDNIKNTPYPKAIQDLPLNISSSEHAFFTRSGASTIKGNVSLIQPGREIKADCVTFFRDNKTSKISSSILVGHAHFHEYGKLIVAEQSNLDFVNEVYTLNNGIYRLLASTTSGLTNVWGKAKHAVYDAKGVLKMRKATYSACPPDATSWHIWSNKLTIDRNSSRGEASNTFLFFKKIPILYTPYLTFSINKERKSGFLSPDVMISKNSGLGVFLAYYFNLAPNYDATFTPEFFTKRGILFNGIFNYLTTTSSGNINANYIHHDKAFINFRDNAAIAYQAGPAFNALQKSSSNRGFLNFQNYSRLNEHWNSSLTINYTTDDYFLRDFSVSNAAINQDQLPNQAELNYANENWSLSSRLQAFQTLHPVGREVTDQYKRLPQINLTADFPQKFGDFDYHFDSEIVHFLHSNDFYKANPIVDGGRFNIAPSISFPYTWLGGIDLIPKIQLQATGYSLRNQEKADTANTIVRFLPIISFDSKAIFDRNINFFQDGYTQTLEPRLFYLYVPTKNQENIPLFDTGLPALDFDQLFRTNRFSGVDRIGDANQLTVVITTRLINDYGQEKFNAGIGQIIVMHKHKVIINNQPFDPLTNENLSPLIGLLQYFATAKLNTKINAVWDPNYHRFNNANISLQYNDNAQKVFNFWYNYGLHQDGNANLSRIGFSIGWNIWSHWNILGNLDYNVSYKRMQNYTYGLEYDSCCWAVRLMGDKTYVGPNVNNNYDSRVYLQFFFKGLGDYGFGNAINASGSISGYNDKHVMGL